MTQTKTRAEQGLPPRRINKRTELTEYLDDLRRSCPLDSWNSFVEELQVPGELLPALMTQRTELLALLKPRELSESECDSLYKLIAGLVKTNRALQLHAQQLATLVENWENQFSGLEAIGRQISEFAQFQRVQTEEEQS